MTLPRPSVSPRRPTARRLACLVAASLLALPLALAAEEGDWVEFTDETASRLVADASVGVSDTQEKDITSGDVDLDGDIDVVIVRKQPFTTPGGKRNVLLMNENGVLTDRTQELAAAFLQETNDRDVELVDVNGDGWLDIVTGGTFEQQPRLLMNLKNDGGGQWLGFRDESGTRLPILTGPAPDNRGPFFCGLGVGDLTGDNRPELYFTDYGGLVIGGGNNSAGEPKDVDDRLLINNGNGFFSDQTVSRIGSFSESLFGTDADIADINGDGFNDIVKTNSTGFAGVPQEQPEGGNPSPAALVLYNDGTAHFTFMDTVYSVAPYMVEPADFTQDGRLDLIAVDDFQDAYLVNTGNDGQGHANFTTHSVTSSNRTSGLGGNVKFADLDNDGVLDAMVADVDTDIHNCDQGRLALLRGQGTPPAVSYSDPLNSVTRPWNVLGTFDMEALYINEDDALDLVVGSCSGLKIFMGVSHTVFQDGFESGNTSAWTTTAQ
ncbi:MAG: VCBS repeat-containing protein [Thermoanaerobaculia bacterium]